MLDTYTMRQAEQEALCLLKQCLANSIFQPRKGWQSGDDPASKAARFAYSVRRYLKSAIPEIKPVMNQSKSAILHISANGGADFAQLANEWNRLSISIETNFNLEIGEIIK